MTHPLKIYHFGLTAILLLLFLTNVRGGDSHPAHLSKIVEKKHFCKVLKINCRLKKFNFLYKKFFYLFADIKICFTFALAFGKQRGNAVL